jgi:hypothetical protein
MRMTRSYMEINASETLRSFCLIKHTEPMYYTISLRIMGIVVKP